MRIGYEAIIDDDRRSTAFGLLMSLNMLIEGAGFDYTGADIRAHRRAVHDAKQLLIQHISVAQTAVQK
jgi:hypothetical protein